MNRHYLLPIFLLLLLGACKVPQTFQKPTTVDVQPKIKTPEVADTVKEADRPKEIAPKSVTKPDMSSLKSGVATYKISNSFINNYRPKQSDLKALEYQAKVSFNERLAKADFKRNSRYFNLSNGKESTMRSRLGKKYLVEGASKQYDIQKTEEVKTIGAYTCYKMTGKAADGTEVELYYTKDIPAKYNPVFPTEGFTVQYQIKTAKQKSTYTLKELKPAAIEDAELSATGFSKVTQAEYERGDFKGPIVGFMKGEKALDFERRDLEGKSISPSSLKGKVVVLNFWFAACSPCKEEVPEFVRLKEKYADKDVEFVAVTYDQYQVAKAFVDKTGFDFRIVPSSKDVMEAYKILIYPTTLVIDKSGIVRKIIEKPTNSFEVGREVDRWLY